MLRPVIRCSLGTAAVLGLKNVKVDAAPTTAYLMIGERCRANCAFCTQARDSKARANMLSRVTWPAFADDRIIKRLSEGSDVLKRVCFQVVRDPKAMRMTKDWVTRLKTRSKLPICVSAGVRSLSDVSELLGLGVDHVSIALDAASAPAFDRANKGVAWQQRLDLLREAAAQFPGHIVTHLIVGLGESEEEIIRLLEELFGQRVLVALFAFTPVRGTAMESLAPPGLISYRKIQVAYYLLKNKYASVREFTFCNGNLTRIDMPEKKMAKLLMDGEAFRTTGCAGCNRPYYNEKPGQELYNYPYLLTGEEAEGAWKLVHGALEFSGE